MDEIIEILCLRYLEKIKDKNFGENEFSKDHIEKMLNELLNNKSSWTETLPALKMLRISQARVLSFVNQDPDCFEKHSVCLDFSTL